MLSFALNTVIYYRELHQKGQICFMSTNTKKQSLLGKSSRSTKTTKNKTAVRQQSPIILNKVLIQQLIIKQHKSLKVAY